MLYDQAQLVHAYVDAAQLTGDPQYADVAADTLRYVRRDLTDPDGGFYSAEDADSVPPEHAGDPTAHKMEGAFYIWSDAEVRRLLGDRAEPFCRRYGVLENGNAPFDPQNEFTGKNLLLHGALARGRGRGHRPHRAGASAPSWRRRARCCSRRGSAAPRPHLDDKVLTAWNGLMIGACARAGRILGDPSWVADAARAAGFLRARLWDRRVRDAAAPLPPAACRGGRPTPKTTPTWPAGCWSCSRPPAIRRGSSGR